MAWLVLEGAWGAVGPRPGCGARCTGGSCGGQGRVVEPGVHPAASPHVLGVPLGKRDGRPPVSIAQRSVCVRAWQYAYRCKRMRMRACACLYAYVCSWQLPYVCVCVHMDMCVCCV